MKDEDVFVSTTRTASVRMVLSQVTDLRNESYTVFKGSTRKTRHIELLSFFFQQRSARPEVRRVQVETSEICLRIV